MPLRRATRRFWPGRRTGTARPPAPTSSPTGSPGSARATLSSLPPSAASPEERRFAQVYAADRVGPMPYPQQATPDVGAARGRVRSLVSELLEGVDEGTGGALDPLIASWASGWLSRIDSQHADHQAVIDRLVGGARQQLADAEAAHERDRRALAVARRDYDEARERLSEPVGGPEPDRSTGRHAGRTRDPSGLAADPPTGPMPRPRTDGAPTYSAPSTPAPTHTAPTHTTPTTRAPDRGDPMTDDPAGPRR